MHIGDIVEVKAVVQVEYPFYKNGMRRLIDLDENVEIVAQPAKQSGTRADYDKCLVRYKQTSRMGVLVGKTRRAVGVLCPGHQGDPWNDDYDEGSLSVHSWHDVWVVAFISKNDRYLKPVLALEEDLELKKNDTDAQKLLDALMEKMWFRDSMPEDGWAIGQIKEWYSESLKVPVHSW